MPTAIMTKADNKIANKVGRPEKYKPEFCEMIIEFGKEGYGREEIAPLMGISREALDRWKESHPEFRSACTRGHELAYLWWTRYGRDHMAETRDNRTNDKIWALNMMNRFGWNKKEDITSGGEKLSLGDITIEMQRRSVLYSPANVSAPQLEQGGASSTQDARN
jgi:hypothetical protein